MSSSSNSSGGIGLTGLLTVAFVVLKLTGVIHWSWLWVLAPLWISASLVGLLIVVIIGAQLYENKTMRKLRAMQGRSGRL